MRTEQIATFTRRTNELYRRLSEGTLPVEATLSGLQDLIENGFDSIVDLDADPHVPAELTVVSHAKGGTFDFYHAKVGLHLTESQKGGAHVEGRRLLKEMKGRRVFNANLLDWLLRKENQRFIPAEWKELYVGFWGTVYRNLTGDMCVRRLCRRGNGWTSEAYPLDYRMGADGPAAVRKR